MNNVTVTKSNLLIESSYRLSLSEQRILLSCISQISNKDNTQKRFTLSVSDYAEMFEVGAKSAYREMYSAADKLFDRSIIIKNESVNTKFRWVQEQVVHAKGEGKIELVFSDRIVPYLFQLKEQFTSYQLTHVSKLKSTYSIRLYELLMQFKSTKRRVIDVSDFRIFMGTGDKYATFKTFSQKVIKKAMDELNLKSNLNIKLEKLPKNRACKTLVFTFNYKKKAGDSHQQTSLNLPQSSPKRREENQQRIASIIEGIKS
jgi:plasmid replication initiation protein